MSAYSHDAKSLSNVLHGLARLLECVASNLNNSPTNQSEEVRPEKIQLQDGRTLLFAYNKDQGRDFVNVSMEEAPSYIVGMAFLRNPDAAGQVALAQLQQ